ncbi:MAG: twin-arginine translocation signal domain-containing protein [Anaerolineales bacterium]|nr:twin-arginine translocation signal domain-containing protein [Anaerolineales bacterium]
MDETKATPEETNLSRRELLKALAAAGGALGAAAFLPGKWAKPLVEAGVLPAHAQATQDSITIERLSVFALGNKIGLSPSAEMYGANFHFEDLLCEVTVDSAKLWAWASPCGSTFYSGQTLSSIGAVINASSPCMGVVAFSFDGTGCVNSTLWVQLGVGSRKSNTTGGNIPPHPF